MTTLRFATAALSVARAVGQADAVARAVPEARTVSGLLVPWGVIGRTSAGPIRVRRGAIRVPTDPARVKLYARKHSDADDAVAVGHGVRFTETDEGLEAEFRVGTGPEADQALREAAERITDGLSYELLDLELDGDEVTAADLVAAALVPVPAYADARVRSVAASHNPHNPNGALVMTEAQRRRLAALRASQSLTQQEATEMIDLVALEAQEAAEAQTPEAQVIPAEPVAQVPAAAAAQSVPSVHAAAVPGLLVPGRSPAQTSPRRTLDSLYAAVAGLNTGTVTPEVTAALADITSTAHTPFVSAEGYLGELWSGVPYTRRFVNLLNTSRSLTSWKVKGWKWTTKPTVGDYAGDKTAVPSNTPVTEAVEAEAARLAGGHDIDRKYVDFRDTEFLAAYYTAMAEDYARKSDAKALAFILANDVDSGTDVSRATYGSASILRAAAISAHRVRALTGADADWIVVNDTDMLDLLDVDSASVSAFLDLWGINPGAWVADSSVPVGSVIAGVQNGAEFLELPGSPVRVNAVNVANGGVDEAVFGYWAALLHHTSAFVRTDIVA